MSIGSSGNGPGSAASSAINIPFTFAGCSSPPSPGPGPAVLSRSGGGLTVDCPARSQRVACLLRLSRPCRLTRVIVRNAGCVFLRVRSAPPSAAVPADGDWTAVDCCDVVIPEHQLCAADVWRDSSHAQPLPAPLLRVHTFPSAAAMRGAFSPQLADRTTAALWVELRGAEDDWSRNARLGLSWLEVFGVPVPVQQQ